MMSTTVKPATGSRSSMSTMSVWAVPDPITIVRCRKCPYMRSWRSHDRRTQRTVSNSAMPTAKVISTNPRDRSSLSAKDTMAIAAKTNADAPTIRLNSSEPTPRMRVS